MDDTDPFALLNSDSDSSLSDWSSFWSQHSQNDISLPLDFAFPMEIDQNNALTIAVEPSALHFHPHPHHLLSSFPFTFSSPTSPSELSAITSPTVPIQPKLPIPRLLSSIPSLPSSSRPQKHKPAPQPYLSSSPSSSPSPPTTPSSDSVSSAHNIHPIPAPIVPGVSRPKTSHTTIERRYRTNLNTRIQSLKAAVPALRVLDQNTTLQGDVVDERGYIDGVKVARKGSKANVLGKAVEYICVLKRREFRLKREQEGLRTLILGIPGTQPLLAEWDHGWAKKFGGPERDEIDNDLEPYEHSDDEEGDGEDDGDDSERVRKKPKLAKLPALKKDKHPSPPAPGPSFVTEGFSGIVPEKRKRGRPRKIQPNVPIAPAPPGLLSNPVNPSMQVTTQVPQPQQYLLAVFALFSFFNSPFTSTPASQSHTHKGSVLSHVTAHPPDVSLITSWSWNSIIQAIHLFVSVLVLVTIVFPWLPLPRLVHRAKILRLVPFSSLIYSQPATHQLVEPLSPPLSPDVSDTESDDDSISTEETICQEQCKGPLSDTLSQRGSPEECECLIHALGLTRNALQAVRNVFTRRTVVKSFNPETERRAWVRVAELIVLHPSSATAVLRLQVYLRLSSLLGASPTTTNHACDLATLALLAHSLTLFYVKDRSQRLWNRARAQMGVGLVRPYERLVLNTISLEEAVQMLTSKPLATSLTPLGALATTLLHQRLRSHTSDLFVQTVARTQDGALPGSHAADEVQWRETLDASQSLGGSIGAVADSFAKVWESGLSNVNNLAVDDEDIKTLLTTVVLFRRIFSSRILCCGAVDSQVLFILSPPPSPPVGAPQKEAVLQLRRALASSVFEEQSEDRDELEDARDRVVDMLVEYERRGRSRVSRI